jgi:hypothetical protein
MTTYEVIEIRNGQCIKATLENNEVLFIPTDLANSDYQAYLKSLDEAATL